MYADYLRCRGTDHGREVQDMSACETTSWTLDCGSGHGCYLIEDSKSTELLAWGCSSELVTGRRRRRENQETYIDRSVELHFCCRDITRARLAEALDDLVAAELVVPKGKHGEKVLHCGTGTMDDIIRDIGLSMRD